MKIFICCSSKDKEIAYEYKSKLNELSHESKTGANIVSGTKFGDSLKSELESADIIIILLTNNFICSSWSDYEMNSILFTQDKSKFCILSEKEIVVPHYFAELPINVVERITEVKASELHKMVVESEKRKYTNKSTTALKIKEDMNFSHFSKTIYQRGAMTKSQGAFVSKIFTAAGSQKFPFADKYTSDMTELSLFQGKISLSSEMANTFPKESVGGVDVIKTNKEGLVSFFSNYFVNGSQISETADRYKIISTEISSEAFFEALAIQFQKIVIGAPYNVENIVAQEYERIVQIFATKSNPLKLDKLQTASKNNDGEVENTDKILYVSSTRNLLSFSDLTIKNAEQIHFLSDAYITESEIELLTNFKNVSSFEVIASNPLLCSVDGALCSQKSNSLKYKLLKVPPKYEGVYKISGSIDEIGENCFSGANQVIAIIVPNSVSHVHNYAFSNCDSLEEIVFENGNINVAKRAFADCQSLERIKTMGRMSTSMMKAAVKYKIELW